MWLMTPRGFYSIVEHRNRNDCVLVRSRVRADLEGLLELDGADPDQVEYTPEADYPYRVGMHKRRWERLLGELAREIRYPNFKTEVARAQGPARARIYHELWHRLLELEREDPDLAPLSPWRLVEPRSSLGPGASMAVQQASQDAFTSAFHGNPYPRLSTCTHPATECCDDCIPF